MKVPYISTNQAEKWISSKFVWIFSKTNFCSLILNLDNNHAWNQISQCDTWIISMFKDQSDNINGIQSIFPIWVGPSIFHPWQTGYLSALFFAFSLQDFLSESVSAGSGSASLYFSLQLFQMNLNFYKKECLNSCWLFYGMKGLIYYRSGDIFTFPPYFISKVI